MYEEARSRAVVEVGALGMVPMYLAHKKTQLLLERGCERAAREALLPGIEAMNQRIESEMDSHVDKAEFAVVPTIPRFFSQMQTKFTMHTGEIMLQMGQIVKVVWRVPVLLGMHWHNSCVHRLGAVCGAG